MTRQTFGVELDLMMPAGMTRRKLVNKFNAAGIKAWKLIADDHRAEVISPMLSGAGGLAQLRKVSYALRTAGCRVNRSCGFNVHVGAQKEVDTAWVKFCLKLVSAAIGGNNSAMPTKPIVTSQANISYQKHFDKLAAYAESDNWDAVRDYPANGVNSYAKMVRSYRDALLAAHKNQEVTNVTESVFLARRAAPSKTTKELHAA